MVDSYRMENNTAQQILDVAQEMLRSRGYSAFSYADISDRIGIRKASIHYHFPTKDDLVRRLVQRYRETLLGKCNTIAHAQSGFHQQLFEFATLYRDGLEAEQICLCSMLTADLTVLPPAIRVELQSYFQDLEAWLSQLLHQGYGLDLATANLEAKGLIALLQGVQLIARTQADRSTTFDQIVYPLLARKFPEQ
jgi:TetR/AcrR family transcriptional regulator, transcriptional repressor for nem operon